MSGHREPEPSEPTQPFGAPHIGTDWTWGSPEGRPAAWQAFGQDTSGHGPGCPDCANTDPTSQGATP